jgi:hypothetical protein
MLFKAHQSPVERFYTLPNKKGGLLRGWKTSWGAVRAKKAYLQILLGLLSAARLVSLLERLLPFLWVSLRLSWLFLGLLRSCEAISFSAFLPVDTFGGRRR